LNCGASIFSWKSHFLSQHQVNPRVGHLETAYHIFAYLPDMGRLGFDPKMPDINERHFHSNADWKKFYGDVEEEIPPNMPEPRGNPNTVEAATFGSKLVAPLLLLLLVSPRFGFDAMRLTRFIRPRVRLTHTWWNLAIPTPKV
jgi:hypothetical protein